MTIPVVLLSVIIARLFAPVPVRPFSVIPPPTACLGEPNGGACVNCCKEAVGCGPTGLIKCDACAHFCNQLPPPPLPGEPAP